MSFDLEAKGAIVVKLEWKLSHIRI